MTVISHDTLQLLRMRRPLWGFQGLGHKVIVTTAKISQGVTKLGDFSCTLQCSLFLSAYNSTCTFVVAMYVI